jgi:hypothetical protein
MSDSATAMASNLIKQRFSILFGARFSAFIRTLILLSRGWFLLSLELRLLKCLFAYLTFGAIYLT